MILLQTILPKYIYTTFTPLERKDISQKSKYYVAKSSSDMIYVIDLIQQFDSQLLVIWHTYCNKWFDYCTCVLLGPPQPEKVGPIPDKYKLC